MRGGASAIRLLVCRCLLECVAWCSERYLWRNKVNWLVDVIKYACVLARRSPFCLCAERAKARRSTQQRGAACRRRRNRDGETSAALMFYIHARRRARQSASPTACSQWALPPAARQRTTTTNPSSSPPPLPPPPSCVARKVVCCAQSVADEGAHFSCVVLSCAPQQPAARLGRIAAAITRV